MVVVTLMGGNSGSACLVMVLLLLFSLFVLTIEM